MAPLASRKWTYAVIVASAFAVVALYKLFAGIEEDVRGARGDRGDRGSRGDPHEPGRESGSRFAGVFARLDLEAKHCEDLSTDWGALNMSRTYYERLDEFQNKLNEAVAGAGEVEGHSNQVPEEMRLLHLLAGVQPSVTVCETGFNYGHSSFNFLTAGDGVKVISFDLGEHPYAPKMAGHLRSKFGSRRLSVVFGDSRSTVTDLWARGGLPPCDVIFVDGGHTLEVARADVVNLAGHASPDNVIVMDDHPTDWSAGFGRAWDERLLRNGGDESLERDGFFIEEVIRCTRRQNVEGLSRGFVVGRVVRG